MVELIKICKTEKNDISNISFINNFNKKISNGFHSYINYKNNQSINYLFELEL